MAGICWCLFLLLLIQPDTATAAAPVNQAGPWGAGPPPLNMTFLVQTLNQVIGPAPSAPVGARDEMKKLFETLLQKLTDKSSSNNMSLGKENQGEEQPKLQNRQMRKQSESVCGKRAIFYTDGAGHCGSCYEFDLVLRDWNEARTYCRSRGGDLVSVETAEESAFLNQIITNHNSPLIAAQLEKDTWFGFWTSGSDKDSEGTWVWTATRAALNYTNWEAGQPNNRRGKEHYLEIVVRNGEWHDGFDSSLNFSICERALMC